MKRFLVKTISKATETNSNFAGTESISYYGKNQKLLGHIGSCAEATHTTMDLQKYLIKLRHITLQQKN